MSVFRQAYDILSEVYRKGAYLNLAMKENSNPRVAKIVFGVMENHYMLEYVINILAPKKAKPTAVIMLKIALTCVIYLKTPLNNVITETNELADSIGKQGLKPFLSAVIRGAAEGKYTLPEKGEKAYNEVTYNMPAFLVGMYKKDYPENYESIINAPRFDRVHIWAKDEKTVMRADPTAIKSGTGYFVKNNKEISLLCFMGQATYISYASTLVVTAMGIKDGQKVLDACAAPGGKAVYASFLGGDVTACDIHPHRVKLICDYARRMRVKIAADEADATIYNKEWEQAFDIVLADAPCSGMGVKEARKDVVFRRTYEDIISLAELQYAILNNVKNYVKKGGVLVYSTCTVFNIENGGNIDKFLSENSDFYLEEIPLNYKNDGRLQLLPDGSGMEGFYICRMRRR